IDAGVPFLAAATGGIPELICESDRPLVLFDYDAARLEARLADALDRPPITVRPTFTNAENGNRWIEFHARWQDHLAAVHRISRGPQLNAFFSVVIFGADSRQTLTATLSSLATTRSTIAQVLVIGNAAKFSHRIAPSLPVMTADRMQASQALRDLAGKAVMPVVFVKAGARLAAEGLAKHLRGLVASELDGVIPAGRLPCGRLVMGLGHGVPVALHEGIMQTGGAIMTHPAMARGLSDMPLHGDPVVALNDAIVLSGAEIGASPLPAFDLNSGEGLRPTITHGRVALYAEHALPT